jgi:hypothetical protein
MNYVNGLYEVENQIYLNKVQAILEGSKNRSKVKWKYYDDIFSKAAAKPIEKISIVELYRQRAEQLRGSYDYLILNYSGGSDSHNILQTFIKYNIKLDAIYVQWPESLMDKGLYVPNSVDKSNANFHSEWDLVLKKDLEWISKNKPEIKIEIDDWTHSIKEKFYNDDLFLANVSNLPSIARSQKQNTFSKFETKWASQGKKVASIFGVDKTNIVSRGNEWYFYFMDTAFMAQPNPENPYGLEYFYHTPKFPELAVVQAKMLIEWYKQNPKHLFLVKSRSEREIDDPTYKSWPRSRHYEEFSQVSEIFKFVCYPFWDFNRFQADKPFAVLDGFKMGTRAWDNILTALPNFKIVQQKWEYNWKSYLKLIDPDFMRNRDTLGVISSRWHRICI